MISRIVLGTAQLGMNYGVVNKTGQPNLKTASEIIDTAASVGIKSIDTAYAYGGSQERLGQLHGNRFHISSKWINDPDTELEASLRLLRLSSLDVWMAHKSESLLHNPEFYLAMKKQKELGLVKRIGVSVYDVSEVEKLWDAGVEIDVVQLPIHALQRNAKLHVEKLRKNGVEVHARSIFLQGLLLASPESIPQFFHSISPWLLQFTESFPSKTQRLQALIEFVLLKLGADFVVIGAEVPSQILDWTEGNSDFLGEQVPEAPDYIDDEILNPKLWPSIS